MRFFIPQQPAVNPSPGQQARPEGEVPAGDNPLPQPAPVCEVRPGVTARLYPARPACRRAGYCRWLRETDCELYPAAGEEGLMQCRERV